MPTATVRFSGCLQNSQMHGSDDEHMVSEVYLAIEAGRRVYPGLTVQLKQTVGDDFETGAIEVSTPPGCTGPMNFAAFSRLVAEYYRSLVGGRGKGIHIDADSQRTSMSQNRFNSEVTGFFQYEG